MNDKARTRQDNIDPVERRLKKHRVNEAKGKVQNHKENKYRKRPIDYLQLDEYE